MENIVTNTHSSIPPIHTYARQSISISPHSDSNMKLGKHVCPVCRISFKRPVNLKNHVSKIHAGQGQGLAENPNSKQQACMVSTCSLKFRTVDKLIEHVINVHKADINIEHLTFDQSSLFSEFLKREEIVTNTRCVKKSKHQVNKKGEKNYSYVCHRNGKTTNHMTKCIKAKSARKRRKGHCQINGLCPARMSVCERPDGKVQVRYIKSHSHSLSLEQSKYLPIPDSLRSEILNMLSLKIPVTSIIDKIRGHFSDRDNRDNLDDFKYYHLIDRKTIHNLKTKLSDPTVIQDSNDALSTTLKVEALRYELFNPVLIFKQQGVDDELKVLQRDDFLLVIMTKQQLHMYEKFGGRIVCMDSTHSTNSYSFKLITLMVPDEFRKGYPIAFCISNREDETAISLFLSAVKKQSPDTKVSIIMTDDDNAGWNAARSVYGSGLQQFLCTWHIQRSWIRNVHNHVKDDVHKAEVYIYLSALLNANSESDFEQYKTSLVSKLETINPSFLKYLTDHYFNRPEKWSKCYRKRADYCNVDTNMFVESFHNQLKTIYFSGKRNRRLDVLLDTLLRIENDHYIRYLKMTSYNNPTDEDVRLQDRHNRGLEIDDARVKQISNTAFSLESSTQSYAIEMIVDKCSHVHCYTKCKTLPCINLCSHMYTCTCDDYHNGHICKHIHKIHSLCRTLNGHVNDSANESDFELVNPDPVTDHQK